MASSKILFIIYGDILNFIFWFLIFCGIYYLVSNFSQNPANLGGSRKRAMFEEAKFLVSLLAKVAKSNGRVNKLEARLISETAADDAVFTADVGTPVVWAARYLKMNGRRRLLGSFNHGFMANALLQAMGAQAASLQRLC